MYQQMIKFVKSQYYQKNYKQLNSKEPSQKCPLKNSINPNKSENKSKLLNGFLILIRKKRK